MLTDYEIQGKTECKCGHLFDIKDMKELERINQPGFYGNITKHCSHIKCPNCGREVLLLIKQAGQTYKVIDVGIKKSPKENVQETVKTYTENVQTIEDKPSTAIEEEKQTSNELICPVCGKACKSKIGLNAHMKVHQN